MMSWPATSALIRRISVLAMFVSLSFGFAHAQTGSAAAQQTASTSIGEAGSSSSVPAAKQETHDENDEYLHSPTVVKLGALIGLDAEQAATAFTVFNFLVLVSALGYFVLKTLPTTFRNRKGTIKKQLEDARTATEEAKVRLSSVEQRLSKLDEQIAEMTSQSEADVAREEQRVKAAIEGEKARILAAAQLEIHNASAIARREIQSYAAGLAIEQAARKLTVTADADQLLIENFVSRLKSQKGSEN